MYQHHNPHMHQAPPPVPHTMSMSMSPHQQQQQQQQQLQQQQFQQQQQQMMVMPAPARQDMIPLARVIEFACQKAYTDLNLLSELLHSKNDIERKIELVKYLSRIRYTLIRLLALVKWASGASRVDQCEQIIAYLEEQSNLLFGTANWLMDLAKGTLTGARLPPFATITAVDIFTQHTYTRLPACVKRLAGIPPEPIQLWEQRECLEQLDSLILYRLTMTEIPLAMRQIKVYNGRAVLTVPHEFSVSLTLMSDSLSNPWRILNIKCLLRDLHTGRGKPLVHPLQMQWLHQRCQDRIISKDIDPRPPLVHLYDMLHSFCTFLQLDLLYEQACRLIRLRFEDLLTVEKYTPGSSLQLVYWRDLRRPAAASYRVRGHSLRLHADPLDPRQPICITHFPDLSASDAISIGRCIRSDELSLERLLDRTIQCRSRDLLYKAYKLLALLVAEPPVRSAESLTISLLQPSARHERLSITVNAYRGLYAVRLPSGSRRPCRHLAELEDRLNEDQPSLRRLATALGGLRAWLLCRRVQALFPDRRVASSLPTARPLPLAFASVVNTAPHVCYVQLHRYQSNYLALVPTGGLNPGFTCYYITGSAQAGYYLRPAKLCQMRPPDLLQPTARPQPTADPLKFLAKCRQSGPLSLPRPAESRLLQAAWLGEFVDSIEEDHLLHQVMCELARSCLPHREFSPDSAGMRALTLHSFPTPPGISAEAAAHASSLVQSLTLRLYKTGQYQPPASFRVPPPRAALVALVREWRLSGCPLDPPDRRARTCPPCVHLGVNELGPSSRCAEAVGSVLSEWHQLCHLVQMCLPLTRRANWPPDTCLVSFGFPGLRIAYGPVRDEEGVPVWEMHMIQKAAAGQKPDIYINFVSRRPSAPNPHFRVREQLSKDFLRHHSVLHLLRQLASSHRALAPLACLAGGWHISPQLVCCRQTVLLAHPYRLQLEYRGRVTLSIRLDADSCVRLTSPQLTPLQLIRLHPAARIDSDQSVALPAADWATLKPDHWLACACQFLFLCQTCDRQQQQLQQGRHELLDDGCQLSLRTDRFGCLIVRLCLEGVLCHVEAGPPALAMFVQRLLFQPPYRWQAVPCLMILLGNPGALSACLCLEEPSLLLQGQPWLTQVQLLTVKWHPATPPNHLGMPAVGQYRSHDQRTELYFGLLLTDCDTRRSISVMLLYDELKNEARLLNPFAAGGSAVTSTLMRLDAEVVKPVQARFGNSPDCLLPHLFRAMASRKLIP